MLKKIYSYFKKSFSNQINLDMIDIAEKKDYKSVKVNIGQLQSHFNSLKGEIKSFSEVEFRVFSQFGDDGIIQWLINKLPLPNKTFIEFGVENYREANSRFLLVNNYWSGLIIDGDEKNIQLVNSETIASFFDLQTICAFITKKNINELILTTKFKKDVGLLSIDIDGNDYWVWKEITTINPIIVVIEYNSLFGFEHAYSIPYEDKFVRGTTTPFNFYGTSLLSAYDLAEEKGYGFIGCNSAGNNAYFIRKDYLQYLPISTRTPEEGYNFASFTEARDSKREFLRGWEKVSSINNLSVINTRSNSLEKLDAQAIISSLTKANKLSRD